MEFLNKTKTFLGGKKAYIAGALMIVAGFMSDNTELIWQGIGVITLRAGIAKI